MLISLQKFYGRLRRSRTQVKTYGGIKHSLKTNGGLRRSAKGGM